MIAWIAALPSDAVATLRTPIESSAWVIRPRLVAMSSTTITLSFSRNDIFGFPSCFVDYASEV